MNAAQTLIRDAVTADESAIRQIARAAYERYVSRIGREPAPMIADFPAFITAGVIEVIECDQAVAGYVVSIRSDDSANARAGNNSTIQIENIAVDPQFQGCGLGRALMQHVETRARRIGCSSITLYTNIHMTENLQFYRALGYQETGRRTEDGFDRVYFAKALAH